MLNALIAERLLSRGQRALKAGDSDASLAIFDRGLQMAPNAVGIHLHKALALAEQHRRDEAISTLETAIELDPSRSALHLWLGILYFDLDRMGEAVEQFDRSLAISPDNDLVSSFKYLALAVAGRDVVENCSQLLNKVEFNNSQFKSRLLLFTESVALQNDAEARYLNDMVFHATYLQQPSKGASLQSRLSRFYTRLRYALSPTLRQAILHYTSGQTLLREHRFDRAETEFKQALDMLPEFEEARILLIDLLLYRKQIAAVQVTLKSHPAYRLVAPIVYAKAPLADRENELGPHLSLVLALGIYHFYAKEFEKAIRCIEFIAGLSGNYFDDYYLGLCHLARGDRETAFGCFKNAMQRLNPNIASGRLKEALRLSALD